MIDLSTTGQCLYYDDCLEKLLEAGVLEKPVNQRAHVLI